MGTGRERFWRVADRIYDAPHRAMKILGEKLTRPPGMSDDLWIAQQRTLAPLAVAENPALMHELRYESTVCATCRHEAGSHLHVMRKGEGCGECDCGQFVLEQ